MDDRKAIKELLDHLANGIASAGPLDVGWFKGQYEKLRDVALNPQQQTAVVEGGTVITDAAPAQS